MTRRRALLAGVGGVVGTVLLGRTARANAADGGSLTLGSANTSTAQTSWTNNGTDITTAIMVTATGTGTDGFDAVSQGAATTNNPGPVGVFGSSTSGDGVFGDTTANNFGGVTGNTSNSSSVGVAGFNQSGVAGATGTYGQSDAGYGVFGFATSGSGVVGESTSGPGLQGFSTSQAGLTGTSSSNYGAFGSSSSGPGLGGFSTTGYGGFFQTETASQYAAYINNTKATSVGSSAPGLAVNGSFVVLNGTKSAAVDIDGELRLMYAVEAPQSLFEDVGRAKLVNGRATVVIDPLFVKAIVSSDYHVFLTPSAASSKGLAVVARRPLEFIVQELGGGTGDYEFDYRLVAVRRGLPDSHRFAPIARPSAVPVAIDAALLTRPTPPLSRRPFKSMPSH
jgi:hypothetical protein